MAAPIVMPRLGLSMVEGTVTSWKVRPGDVVTVGQPILVIESEKAEVEIESFAAGTVAAIYVDIGTTVPIGSLLGAVTTEGESFDADAYAAAFVPDTEGAPATAAPTATTGRTASAPLATPARESAGTAPKAAPAARALAKKLGIDLARVRGSGPGGRILPEDVERAAAGAGARAPLDGEVHGAVEGTTIVLVCGYGVDRSGWRRQIDGLSPRHAVATFDHRGVGKSAPVEGALTIADLADDAAAWIAAQDIERPLLVGSSLGAAVALELCLRGSVAPRGLVCLSPAVAPDARFATVLRSWSTIEPPDSEERIGAMLPWLFGRTFLEHEGKRAAAANALRIMARQTSPAALRAHGEALLTWLGSRLDDLHTIRVPTLVLVGDEDVLTPVDQARRVATRIPGARLELVLGAGHALMVERPEALNLAVAALAG